MKTENQAEAGVSARTIERLIIYRSLLEEMARSEKTHVVSGDIAELVKNTAAQVRRDLMVVGYTGSTGSGYRIDDLLGAINSLLEPKDGITVAIAGIGNLGRALLGYFSLLQPRFKIVGAFDNDENKVNRLISGYRVHHWSAMPEELAKNPAQVGIVTVPSDHAQKTVDVFLKSGVKGLVNFAPLPVHVPAGVWLENVHITATLEKVAYFSRMAGKGGQP